MEWSLGQHAAEIYRQKFEDIVAILNEWVGGFSGKQVLEFGCGYGEMAYGVALQHKPNRLVGIDISDKVAWSLDIAREQIGITEPPPDFRLDQVKEGADLADYGTFDVIYSWSVFEHVAPELLSRTFETVRRLLNPAGVFMLQISPLYYSRDGAHLNQWLPLPWGHLRLTDRKLRDLLFAAPALAADGAEKWPVYASSLLKRSFDREAVWGVYQTLNKVTVPRLERLVDEAGFKIVRDYRTTDDDPIPDGLLDTFHESVLRTNQIVWLLRPR